MPKERNYNPVQAQRKADKAKAIKKGKNEVAARRNEKLAKRNPERIQKQIDDLKKITESGGKLTNHEEAVLESLERDLRQVKKAREALGDKAPVFRTSGPGQGNRVLGKRRRDDEDASSSDGDVPDDVKSIPMPRDTPPPIPKEVMDKWYAKRRAARRTNTTDAAPPAAETPSQPTAPLEVKTVYESKPVMRDLRKEAAQAFLPTAVKMKMDKGKGHGGLLEPEEADRLEKEGYMKTTTGGHSEESAQLGPHTVTMEEVEDEDDI